MGSYAFSKNYMVKSSLKVFNILQSIENFESYRNHCLHLIHLFVFIETNQWQRRVYNFDTPCIKPVQSSGTSCKNAVYISPFGAIFKKYVVMFSAESSNTIMNRDNQRHTMTEVHTTVSFFFRYDISSYM